MDTIHVLLSKRKIQFMKKRVLNVTIVKKCFLEKVVSKITFLVSMVEAKTSNAKYVKKYFVQNLRREPIQKPFMKMKKSTNVTHVIMPAIKKEIYPNIRVTFLSKKIYVYYIQNKMRP